MTEPAKNSNLIVADKPKEFSFLNSP